MPAYVSLQNNINKVFRYNHATKMQKEFKSPECLFNLISEDGGKTYAIKNILNNEYFDCTITSMAKSVEGNCEKWQFLSIPTIENGYYIQNIENNKYMTKKASELTKNAGIDEVYIIIEHSL